MGCDICIIDEAAHVDPALFYKVVVPILSMQQTALLALSSPEGSQNYFSKLIKLIDPNTNMPFFRVCNCFLICEDCRKLDLDEQIKCNHVKQTATWLSSKKTNRNKLLYATDPATAIKELAGVIVDDFIPCFPRKHLEEFFQRPAYVTKSSPEYVVITVDPSGGGMSQLAICSGYYDADLSFVVSRGQANAVVHMLDETYPILP